VQPRDLFEILMREHIDSVRAFLLSSLRDAVAAEDVLQETFLVAWRILDRYDRKLPFGPWVRGIAAKLLLNHREIAHLIGAVERQGYTIVPLELYWQRGKAKVRIGLAKGKKAHDKRATEKDRDWQRDKSRLMRRG
jgi:tmRNA-binding protein